MKYKAKKKNGRKIRIYIKVEMVKLMKQEEV